MKPIEVIFSALFWFAVLYAMSAHRQAASAEQARAAAEQRADTAEWQASAARTDVKRITTYVDRIRVIHDTTTAIQQDIPRYVTPDDDRLYPLPVGFVRVHDAAAAGVPLLAGPGDTDAARSPVAASVALDVIVGNYGTCRETAAQLTALQDWVQSREAATP